MPKKITGPDNLREMFSMISKRTNIPLPIVAKVIGKQNEIIVECGQTNSGNIIVWLFGHGKAIKEKRAKKRLKGKK
jgi:hypothetical protein